MSKINFAFLSMNLVCTKQAGKGGVLVGCSAANYESLGWQVDVFFKFNCIFICSSFTWSTRSYEQKGKKEKLKSLTVSWNQNGRWFDMRGAFGFWNIWEHFSYKSATLIAKMLHWQKQLWSLQDMTRLGPSFVCKERFWIFFFLIQWGVIEEK